MKVLAVGDMRFQKKCIDKIVKKKHPYDQPDKNNRHLFSDSGLHDPSTFHFEFVPNAPNGFYVITFIPQLASQFFYMGINGPGITKIIIVPDTVQDFFSGKCNALILYKIGEQFKLFITKINIFPVNFHFMCCFVYFNGPCTKDVIRG